MFRAVATSTSSIMRGGDAFAAEVTHAAMS
jgi:hypothetical protein